MSSNWTNIFKTGNDTDHETLNTFRQFHCADCLHSFQEKKTQQTNNNNDRQTNENSLRRMNTPPPPLLPVSEDTINGLYHYFGQPQLTTNLRILSNGNASNAIAGKSNPTDFNSDQLNLDSDSSLSSTLFTSLAVNQQQEKLNINFNSSEFSNQTTIQDKKQCIYLFLCILSVLLSRVYTLFDTHMPNPKN